MKKYTKINDLIGVYENSPENIYTKLNMFHTKEFEIKKSEKKPINEYY